MRIIPRSEWGARYANGFGPRPLPATQAWLHHSVTIAPDLVPPFDDDYAAVRTLEQIGQNRFGGGISYTRLFTPAGWVFEGHSIDRIGSHTANRNTVAVGYCLVGNYSTQRPTGEQLRALAWCLQHDHARGWLDAPRLDGGHRDLKATDCPGGHAYAAIPTVNQLAAGGPIQEDVMNADQERTLNRCWAILETLNTGAMRRMPPDTNIGDWAADVSARVTSMHAYGFEPLDGAAPGGNLTFLEDKVRQEVGRALQPVLAKLDNPPPAPVDLDYDRLADAVAQRVNTGVATAVNDDADRRARDGDPATGPTT